MIGHPKYTYGDVVKFKCDEETLSGVIAIIDPYGTFQDNSDVSYDIFVKSENTLYKHFSERYVIEKIGHISEDKIWEVNDDTDEYN